MAAKRVLLGGSFACDDAIARPVRVLLQEATPSDEPVVEVEWLGYGSAADLTSLLQEPLHAVDLVVLVVRLSDLRTAHPELLAATAEASSENRFLEQLRAYDRPAAPPLVVLFCPSPPLSAVDPTTSYELEEAALSCAIQPLQRVACFPSSDATDFFLHDNDDCRWYDVTRDKREHAPFTQPMLDVLALRCVRQIARLRIRSPKKVLVLDCDNTLWGGAVADVGPARVQLSERFLALQRFAVDQQKRGVLLCLCSKNVAEDVDAVFRERASEMVLSKDKHVVVSKVNWRAKSHNLREIAQQLQLGLDAFVFVDDNAVECHEVQSALPMVTVVHVPDDFGPTFLSTQWALDTPFECQATDEDAERTKQYQQNAQRQELERRATSHAAFLSSLGVRIQSERLRDVDSPAFARVLQLHQRTNTFNVATTFSRTLTRERLAAYVATHVALASTVTDRYGHYGLVCATLFRVETDEDGTHTTAVVDSFLMSCRALNRGVEHAMLKQIAETARSRGADTIRVAWEPTVRNEPVRMFFALLSMTVFVTLDGEHVTIRAAKIERSAGKGGWWLLRLSDALKISFLKDQQDIQGQQAVEQEGTMAVVVAWRRPSGAVIVRLAKATIQFVLRWMPRKWIAWLLSWLLLGKKTISSSSDTTHDATKLSFHTRAQLHAFLVARLDAAVETSAQESPAAAVPNPLAEDRETDEAFRLRVRHDTKLLLQQHVAPDEPRVVWAPQRSDDVRFDSDNERVETPSSDTLQQFHRPCATPSCAAQVYWENTCTFRRCRTCCYRVQRLLARATSDQAHAKARAHAWASLANDFNVRANDVEVAQEWCSAHRNDRRRM